MLYIRKMAILVARFIISVGVGLAFFLFSFVVCTMINLPHSYLASHTLFSRYYLNSVMRNIKLWSPIQSNSCIILAYLSWEEKK